MCKVHDVKTQIQHRQIRKPMLLIPECDNAGSSEAGQPEILNKRGWQLLAANGCFIMFMLHLEFGIHDTSICTENESG